MPFNNFLVCYIGFLRDSDSKMTAKMIGQKGVLICASAEWGHYREVVASKVGLV